MFRFRPPNYIQSEWSGLSFWNNYYSNESGTAVLFGETFRPRVNGVLKGTQGQTSRVVRISSSSLRTFTALHQEAHIRDLYVRDFPRIKNGKQRVVLKPRKGKLPSFFQVNRYKASLFFSRRRVSCCPYCEEIDHLGRDCRPRKRERRCFTCGGLDHLQRNCPERYDLYRDSRHPPQRERE